MFSTYFLKSQVVFSMVISKFYFTELIIYTHSFSALKITIYENLYFVKYKVFTNTIFLNNLFS